MALDLPRRDFLRGLLAVAAPAIVSAVNIMPVRALVKDWELVQAWEISTDNLLAEAHEQFSYGWVDVRGVFASHATNRDFLR